ncbi:MAG: hypothetical protein MUP41_18060, partial [Desulfobacterales bacterium]|nr:hypothetical protein [Desulfobacterales bacterium]
MMISINKPRRGNKRLIAMVRSLRKKIFIGYGIALALMVVVFVWALVHLLVLGEASDAILRENYKRKILGVASTRAVAQTHRLPFDRLRANGDTLKSCDFSGHAELVE